MPNQTRSLLNTTHMKVGETFMRIMEYPLKSEFFDKNYFLIDGDAGTKRVYMPDVMRYALGYCAPNRNLLDNWDFTRPVNQRGNTVYTGPTNTIDRWRITGDDMKLTVNDGRLEIQHTGTTAHEFHQRTPISECRPGVHTLSMLTYDGKLYSCTGVMDFTSQINISSDIPEGGQIGIRMTDAQRESGYFVSRWLANGNYSVSPLAMKLEFGPYQTLAYKDSSGNWQLYETASFAEQLAICQRYLIVIGSTDRYHPIGIGQGRVTSAVEVLIHTPVSMRTMPVISVSGTGRTVIRSADTPFKVMNFSVEGVSPAGILTVAYTETGAASDLGHAYDCYTEPGGIVTISAEL